MVVFDQHATSSSPNPATCPPPPPQDLRQRRLRRPRPPLHLQENRLPFRPPPPLLRRLPHFPLHDAPRQNPTSSPRHLSSFSDLAFAVDVSIVLAQAGFCVSYLIFISNSLANVFASQDSETLFGLSLSSLYLWGCFPFQLGLNSIPTLTHLAPLSIFADIVDLGAMSYCLWLRWVMVLVISLVAGWEQCVRGVGVCVSGFVSFDGV